MTDDRPVTVALYDAAYKPKGQVPGYESVSVDWDWLNVGSGTLVVSEADPAAELLLEANLSPTPAVVTVGGHRWSGLVSSTALDFDGPEGTGTVTATLVQDWVWLRYMLASQSGAAPVTQTMRQYDTQTGPAATVAAYYINAAARRLSVPVVAVVAQNPDTSQGITLNARMDTLADLLTSPLTQAGVSCDATIWLPGDNQPPNLPTGVTLTAPTVVFTLDQPPPKPWLRWSRSNGGVTKGTLTVNAATGYRAVLGLNTPDNNSPATRNYDEYVDTDLQTELGRYAPPEVYVDATDATYRVDSQQRGAQELVSHRPTVSAAVEVVDGAPWMFGRDYQPGDLAGLVVAGVVLSQRITRVTVADDRANGLTVTPVVGDVSAAATSDELMVRALSSIAMRVRQLETGR